MNRTVMPTPNMDSRSGPQKLDSAISAPSGHAAILAATGASSKPKSLDDSTAVEMAATLPYLQLLRSVAA